MAVCTHFWKNFGNAKLQQLGLQIVGWKHSQMYLVNITAPCFCGNKGIGEICRDGEDERLWALSAFWNGVMAQHRSLESQKHLSLWAGWKSA